MNCCPEKKGIISPEIRTYLPIIGRILLFLPGISLCVPIIVSIACGIPLPAILALAGSAFLIEYGAVITGIALNIGFFPLIIVISSVALSVMLTSLELFDLVARKFRKVGDFLERVERGRITGFISRYGILGLVPGIIVAGFYICPAVSWIFSWNRCHAIILMLAGYVCSATAVYLLATGIIAVFS